MRFSKGTCQPRRCTHMSLAHFVLSFCFADCQGYGRGAAAGPPGHSLGRCRACRRGSAQHRCDLRAQALLLLLLSLRSICGCLVRADHPHRDPVVRPGGALCVGEPPTPSVVLALASLAAKCTISRDIHRGCVSPDSYSMDGASLQLLKGFEGRLAVGFVRQAGIAPAWPAAGDRPVPAHNTHHTHRHGCTQ